MFADEIQRLDQSAYFPVKSQTSVNDKAFLLGMQSLLRDRQGQYSYLEIGSFLGGSLAPFLKDDACVAILSVDERERQQPDSRGANFDYAGITAQTMIDKLREHGLSTAKLETLDGSIDALAAREAKYDLAFIDGEHTDEACFRDFLWTLPHLKPEGVVMFHDSTFVFRALKLIALYLRSTGREHTMFKRRKSDMTAIVFGPTDPAMLAKYLGEQEDLAVFYIAADAKLLSEQVKYRVRLGFDRKRLIGLKVYPPRVVKAY